MSKKRIIAIASPSGGGKTVVSKFILKTYYNVQFSISATTREKREGEIDGVHYHFLDKETFENKIQNNEFVEYEKIFDNYYGTLRSEIERAFKNDKCLLFDIDVKGACSIKKQYPNDTILIFLMPPSLEVLKSRLVNRKTESIEQIEKRLSRAEMEMNIGKDFDYVVVNNIIDDTLKQISDILNKNLL